MNVYRLNTGNEWWARPYIIDSKIYTHVPVKFETSLDEILTHW